MKIYFNAHNTHHTPRFFLWLENVVIPNYNKCSNLTLTQKIEELLSTHVSACSEASFLITNFHFLITILINNSLMTTLNWKITEYWIDKIWNLEDWNDKTNT